MPNPKGPAPDFSDVKSGSSSAPSGASPPRTKTPPKTYTVKKGDSLSKIAKEQYGDGNRWKAIFEANRDLITNPDLIYPGQVLNLPSNGDDTP